MERASASVNNPQKFYIRIGIRIRTLSAINIRIRTLSAINICIRTLSAINIGIRTMQRRIIEYLVIILVCASDFLQKKQKSYYLKKITYP